MSELPVQMPDLPVKQLGLTFKAAENRQVAYTDKWSAYYYARTHAQRNDEWFSGWNVSTERIFQDFQLTANGTALNRQNASVTVYPYEWQRQYKEGTETFRMFDHKRVLSVQFEAQEPADSVGIKLFGDRLEAPVLKGSILYFQLKELPNVLLGVGPIVPGKVSFSEQDRHLQAGAKAGGFLVVLDSTESKVNELMANARINAHSWALERMSRMNQLVDQLNYIETDQDTLKKAILWNMLTLDELITKQTGYGIYAGLPWFNDYWGRDMFISLPGACLVTGQFEVARKILTSFAEFQNTDASSADFGRVPNRLRPDNIIYNTTDGTPRWVMALYDYVRYTGDWQLIEAVYPAIQRSVEGPLKYWVDGKGYLTHADADTWMDAKIDNLIPWSPRGNRANDIQALWHQQLEAAVVFARHLGNDKDAQQWEAVAQKLLQNFRNDFVAKDQKGLADRLLPNGKPEFILRPNQLFALDLIDNQEVKWSATRQVWSKLTFPWGVASLDPLHPDFHPLHENPAFYHKDAAYHNGTIWVWNNGIAMQRMIEAGQVNKAYELFENMAVQTLDSGVVGGLAENADAFPVNGQAAGRQTGTFLQAWSNAEFLRIWSQGFLGLQPQLDRQMLVLEPAMPATINNLSFVATIGKGSVKGSFSRKNEVWESWIYSFQELGDLTVSWRTGLLKPLTFKIAEGDQLWISIKGEKATYEWKDAGGKVRENGELEMDPAQLAIIEARTSFFEGIDFARPTQIGSQKAVQQKDYLLQIRQAEGSKKKP